MSRGQAKDVAEETAVRVSHDVAISLVEALARLQCLLMEDVLTQKERSEIRRLYRMLGQTLDWL